jgi:serine/threonine protein kinase
MGSEFQNSVVLYETVDGARSIVKAIRLDEDLEGDIAAVAQFEHPCILSIDGYGKFGDLTRISVVTALMEKGSLNEHLRRPQRKQFSRLLSPTKLSKIVSGIVLGMKFMHARNTIHGHLKPTNLLLDEKWRVRISDFSTSKFRGSVDVVHYLSPERFENRPPSREDDVYSFGLILYEVVVGKPAFSLRLRPEAVMRQKLLGIELEIPECVNRRVAALIWRCSSFDCEDRPSFDEILEILKEMNFKIMSHVRSRKVLDFVSQIESWEDRQMAFLDSDGRI